MSDEISPRAAAHAMAAAEVLAEAWRAGLSTGSVDWEEIEYAVELAQEAVQKHAAAGGGSVMESGALPGRWAEEQG